MIGSSSSSSGGRSAKKAKKLANAHMKAEVEKKKQKKLKLMGFKEYDDDDDDEGVEKEIFKNNDAIEEEDESDVDPVEYAIVQERLNKEKANKQKQVMNNKKGKDEENDEEEEEEEDEDAEEEEEDEPVESKKSQKQSRLEKSTAINSAQSIALKARLDSFALPSNTHWIETLAITYTPDPSLPPSASAPIDAFDDLKREAIFYQRSLAGAKAALSQLESFKIPIERPNDYFAEMIKPDIQMERIRESLLIEKKKLQSVAERKRKKEEKFKNKAGNLQKKKEKIDNKLEKMDEAERRKKRGNDEHRDMKVERSAIPMIDELLKKNRKEKGEDGEMDAEKRENRNEISSKKRAFSEMNQRSNSRGPPLPSDKNKKRRAKDSKYGFGGPKRSQKKNNKESARDMSGFSVAKNKKPFAGFKTKGAGGAGGGGKKFNKGKGSRK